MKRIYLDHAAATPLDPRVHEVMVPFLTEEFGNPSSLYHDGRRARWALATARKTIADILHSTSDEIIFTGSGTESDAMALLGIMRKKPTGHLVTTNFEHHAVLYNAEQLEKEGYKVTYVAVDTEGMVSPEDIGRALTSDTQLVSVMYANNEIGTIQPVVEIAKVIKQFKKSLGRTPLDPPFFHTDACQAAGYLDLDVQELGIDLMTVNGSKIYGPRGTGFLYIRRGLKLKPLWFGGGQENKLRSGTENIAGIVGLATALQLMQKEKETENEHLAKLRDYFIAGMFERIPKIVLNGHAQKRLSNNVNMSILDIEGEAMLLYLDNYGIEASTGSACDSATLDPSHVILALGRPYEFAHASMRFTLGHSTTKEDLDYVLKVFPDIVTILRKISPINLELDASQMSTASAFAGAGLPHWEKKRGTKLKMQNT